MKNLSPLILGLLLAGCTRGYWPDYSQNELLVDFPIPPHDREIPIYLPDDTLPDEEYIRVGVLEAWGGAYTSYNELIRYLQEKGRYYGVDAIQLIGKQNYGNPGEYYADAVLSGVGLKYLKNMDYLSRYVKTKEVYLLNNDVHAPHASVAKLWIDFDGRVQRVEGDPAYSEIVEKHSLDHLLYEKDHNWRYALDAFGEVRMRVRSNAFGSQLRVWFTYQYPGRPSTVRIRDYPLKTETLIEFEYDKQGKMIEKLIYLPNDKVLKEIPAYDEAGKQVGSEFLTVVPGQADRPYMRVKYSFYSSEDVQDRIVLK